MENSNHLLSSLLHEKLNSCSDKIIFSENQFKTFITELIFESLSISDEVKKVTSQIMRAVYNQLDQDQTKTEGIFRIFIFETFFYVKWFLYDAREYREPPQLDASVNFGEKLLTIKMIKDDFGINDTLLLTSLQHEIEHIYQSLKKPDNKIFNDKDKKLYKRALKLMRKPKNSIPYNVGRAIYLMFNVEQDGFVNGLYGALKSVSPKMFYPTLRENDAMKQINFLLRLNALLQEENGLIEDPEFLNALAFAKRNTKWFKIHLNKAIIRFGRKIAHIKEKIRQEKEKENQK